VNSSPNFAVPPSIFPDHHPRTIGDGVKNLFSGVWSTEKVVVKLWMVIDNSLFVLP